MTPKAKRNWFYILTFFFWAVMSGLFAQSTIDPFLQNFLAKLLGDKFSPALDKGVEIGENIVIGVLGAWFTGLFLDQVQKRFYHALDEKSKDLDPYIRRTVRESMTDLVSSLGKEAETDAYYSYLHLTHHTQTMKEFVKALKSLPRDPHVVKALVDNYAARAVRNEFLIDFKTFLELGETLAVNNKEMRFVNITPPYEWFCPIRFRDRDEILKGLDRYRKAIVMGMNDGAKIKRITVVRNRDALASVLLDGVNTLREIQQKEHRLIGSEGQKKIIEWIWEILSKFDQDLALDLYAYAQNIKNLYDANNIPVSYDRMSETFTTQDFHKLSLAISKIILQKFLQLHSGIHNAALYLLLDKAGPVLKPQVEAFAKEEGLFYSIDGNIYRLAVEQSDSINILLASISRQSERESSARETYYASLRELIDRRRSNGLPGEAAGNLSDLVTQL